MSREVLVFIIGFILVILPSLGIPNNWKTVALYVIGGLLIVLGYSLRRSAYIRSIEQSNGERSTDSYVESPEVTNPTSSV